MNFLIKGFNYAVKLGLPNTLIAVFLGKALAEPKGDELDKIDMETELL